MNNVSMDDVKKRVSALAKDGHITCRDALTLAETLQISPLQIGKAANLLKIRISACQLGCFK